MPPLPESARAAQSAPPALCPNCADPLDADDRFCGSCGHDLAAPVPAPAPVPAAQAPPAAPPAPAAERPEEGPATDAFVLAPPKPAGAAQEAGGETLALGVALPGARLSDPREEPPAPEGPVCVACGLGGVDDDGYCEHCGHAQPRQRDHQEQELEGVAAVSDRGLRHHRNEDAFAVATASLPDGTPAVAAVVCDGVSTAYRPDDASAAASTAGRESLLASLERGTPAEDAMRAALMSAFEAVTALAAEEEPPGGVPHHNAPACTCVSAVVTGPVFTVGWIGDSRAYWIPDDRTLPASRLTEDDSWAARMVSAGLMSEAEAYADERAHAITGWLGADAIEVDPHVAAFQPEGPGVIVVCTDGLWNYAESAAEMAEAIPADARVRPLHSARTLLGVALDGGGHDNVTVAVLPFPAAVSRAGFPSA
ncbi:PP2C family serine/threonine-protein phosphatase [Actinacidiphila bryophytorum]|uniref:Serine/threonine protein phosphatase PrpC n=1 Tax=Actinacidiphila bryophytorum TaxID=1436133 RepID=A0A9W4E9J3_9ACTN|nr:protein phosphatase 2C domain-containing protein [Actinacidiphila bryophytorum]MBM9434466.1 protein phosphatase 2C domain-containing protein [Actinacidiphila bryophytorum]MBN6541940.1 protein phosphatase 2C domain-containing protein [Actinacidiphila bryophytorum]CAG7626408.1 Serine/threonine protein phosphatase PrpC [Actinacidiphila bryophytorum]